MLYQCQCLRNIFIRPKKINVEFPLTLLKKIRIDWSVVNFIFCLNFICYFMQTLVEMFVFYPFNKSSPKLLNGQQIYSPQLSGITVLYRPFSSVSTNLPIKPVGSG